MEFYVPCSKFHIPTMPIIEIKNAQQWDAFITDQIWSQFTQSWAWGEFRSARGHAIKRFVLTDAHGAWLAAALFVHTPKPIVGGYWYAQRGPVIRNDLLPHASDIIGSFLKEVRRVGLGKPSLFWRIEPPLEGSSAVPPAPGLRRSHSYMPASTLLLDLKRPEELLMAGMHEKTRYNIRVSDRHRIIVRKAVSDADQESFLTLNEETAKRDRFQSMPTGYIRVMYEFLHERGMCDIRLAIRDEKVRAASLEIAFGDTVTYLYGASSNAERHFMAPYALHWDAIIKAKESGHRFYDFYGVNPVDPRSPYFKKSWEGITRFKLGWGGRQVDLVGTWELPMRPVLYSVFRMISH